MDFLKLPHPPKGFFVFYKKLLTYEYLRLSATSEIFPSFCSELRPNSLDPALKFTSKLFGVQTVCSDSQQDSCRFFDETGLGPFFFQTNRAAIFLNKTTIQWQSDVHFTQNINLNTFFCCSKRGGCVLVCVCVCVCVFVCT